MGNAEAARLAVAAFAIEHGPRWKSKLRKMWGAGGDAGDLRLARNIYGPSGLDGAEITHAVASAKAKP